ncbi:hypothetical protein TSOC_006607 [Tetrabaena socialis]|uniref:Uncharacterized protein n=1 Tax=Tetrabaena socialis TaxID=47790 RepID=A0A2J8A367_9CHLO|nr:hypothetical protein TSOC_006607 [Tetrabaena socialis]|eukprot:PNH06965.1 hypothetical protein TSOC_006607 [Tetrabaena socialis]
MKSSRVMTMGCEDSRMRAARRAGGVEGRTGEAKMLSEYCAPPSAAATALPPPPPSRLASRPGAAAAARGGAPPPPTACSAAAIRAATRPPLSPPMPRAIGPGPSMAAIGRLPSMVGSRSWSRECAWWACPGADRSPTEGEGVHHASSSDDSELPPSPRASPTPSAPRLGCGSCCCCDRGSDWPPPPPGCPARAPAPSTSPAAPAAGAPLRPRPDARGWSDSDSPGSDTTAAAGSRACGICCCYKGPLRYLPDDDSCSCKVSYGSSFVTMICMASWGGLGFGVGNAGPADSWSNEGMRGMAKMCECFSAWEGVAYLPARLSALHRLAVALVSTQAVLVCVGSLVGGAFFGGGYRLSPYKREDEYRTSS